MNCWLFTALFKITVAARVAEKGKFAVGGCNLVAERHYGLKPSHTPDVPNSPTARLDEVIASESSIQTTQNTERKQVVEMDATSIEPELSEEGTSSGEESDLESCTIEVGGVSESTSLETLRMFFESRRTSGGGKIDGDIGRTSNGNYIVTFKDREGNFFRWQNNLLFCLMVHSDRTYVGTGPGLGPEWATEYYVKPSHRNLYGNLNGSYTLAWYQSQSLSRSHSHISSV